MRPSFSSQCRVSCRTVSPPVMSCHLAAGLVLDGAPERPHRVEVLDFATSSVGLARPADGHVGVDPHRPLLHLGIGGIDGHEDGPQLVDVLAGLLGAGDVRAADDLHQRHARPVVVDERIVTAVDAPSGAPDVGGLARVLLHVGPLDADPLSRRQLQPSVDVERLVVLRDLVVLRHVRVEVVLPVEQARPDARSAERAPMRIASSTARRLRTGSEPGSPSVTGSMLVFGSSPKRFGLALNSLVAVASSTWTSRPTTISNPSRARLGVSGGGRRCRRWSRSSAPPSARLRGWRPRGTSAVPPVPAPAPGRRRAGPPGRCRTGR